MNRRLELEARTLAGVGRGLMLVGEAACLGLAWLAIAVDRPLWATFYLALSFGLVGAGRVLFRVPDNVVSITDRRRRLDVAARIPRM